MVFLGSGVSGLFLQFLPFSFRELFVRFDQIGAFDIFLPFLLVFAVVFGVLDASGIFGGNKGVSLIISLTLGLMITRIPQVVGFFSVAFSGLGIGLGILLLFILISGLFLGGNDRWLRHTLTGIALAVAVFVSLGVFDSYNWFGSYWWQQYWIHVFVSVLAVGVLIAIPVFNKGGGGRSAGFNVAGIPVKVGN